MPSDSLEEARWRAEFAAMSPIRRRMATEIDPAQFAPTQRDVFWRALLAEEDSARRDAREEETRSIARRANILAIVAIVVAISETAWKILAHGQ